MRCVLACNGRASVRPLCPQFQFRDPESGIHHYDVAVGTTPGAADVVGFRDVGLETVLEVSGLGLGEGLLYFTTVRAWNTRGLSKTVTSDGVKIDHSASAGLELAGSAVYLAATGTGSRTTCDCSSDHSTFDEASGQCSCGDGFVATVVPTANGGSRVVCNCASPPCKAPTPASPPSWVTCVPPTQRGGPHELVREGGAKVSACGCVPGMGQVACTHALHVSIACNRTRAGPVAAPAGIAWTTFALRV